MHALNPSLCVLVLVAGCQFSTPRPRGRLGRIEGTNPSMLCAGGRRTPCRSAEEVAARLRSGGLQLLHAAPTPGGVQGATVLTLRTADDVVFDAKWRAQSSASRFNDPWVELGAAHLQRLVLDPDEYVVPPSEAQCIDHESYRILRHRVEPYPGTTCVLGVLSYWLTGAISLDTARERGLMPTPPAESERGDAWLFVPERFESDPAYRRNIANVNVMAFLIAHGDAHRSQFILYEGPPHVFMVDNNVAFEMGRRGSMSRRQDVSRWIVPAIPISTAERLRRVDAEGVESLRVLASFRRSLGGLQHDDTSSTPYGDTAARIRDDGEHVQIGLTTIELQGLASRIRVLVQELDSGGLGVFD